MSIFATEFTLSASDWWGARRLRYNTFLVLGAVTSSLCFYTIWWLLEARLPCAEFVPFLAGGTFIIGLGLANLCYYLGSLTERWLHPKNIFRYRHVTFMLGTAFSLLLLFLPVVGILVTAGSFDPNSKVECVL